MAAIQKIIALLVLLTRCTSLQTRSMIRTMRAYKFGAYTVMNANIFSSLPEEPQKAEQMFQAEGTRSKGFKRQQSVRSKNLLIIGLGNPGPEYDFTRHNVGFRVIDEFAASKKVSMKFTSKFNADYGAIRIGDKNVGLLKPCTYINNSGGPIRKIMDNFQLSAKDILIIADDIALECGVLRLREKGSHGGHNGHRDIEAVLKTKEYARLRLGVSGPGRKPLAEHVLSEFSANEKDLISLATMNCCKTIEDWILEDEIQLVMNRCNPH